VTAPAGWITSPSAGAVINACPLTLKADVTDAGSGVSWVKFWANHDGAWEEIPNVTADAEGWSTTWDCSAVSDQNVQLRITAQDNAGNQGVDLGGIVAVTLAKNPAAAPTATASPIPTLTTAPSQTPAPANTAAPTATSAAAAPQLNLTVTASPTQTTAPAATAAGPRPIFSCPAAVAPLMVGFGFLAWKKRYPTL
jgi:hypothetical protein